MAREYTFTFPRELSELEIEALCARVFKLADTQDDDAVLKLALEAEKYLHSEEHRKQMLLERIEKVEAESEPEAARPKPEPKPRRVTDDKERMKTTKTVYFAFGFTLACVIRLAAEALYKILK